MGARCCVASCCSAACCSTRVLQVHPDTDPVVPSSPGQNRQVEGHASANEFSPVVNGSAPHEASAAELQPPSRPKPKATLIKAIKAGDMALLQQLLDAGSKLEELGMWDNTPLLAACMHGNAEASMKLIEAGALVTARNEHGATPLHYAAVEGKLELVNALIQVSKSSDSDNVLKLVNCGTARIYNRHLDCYAERTPLASAAESGFEDICVTLAKAGAAIDFSDQDGRTPLWLACRNARASVTRVLLQLGADATVRDVHGVSVLNACTSASCNEDVVLALLAHGVGDVNATSGSPLRDAVKAGKASVATALLTQGASLGVPPTGGATPLHAACERGDEHLVGLLVQARADASLKDPAGLTAFDLLRRRGLADGPIVALLNPAASALQGSQDGGTGGA